MSLDKVLLLEQYMRIVHTATNVDNIILLICIFFISFFNQMATLSIETKITSHEKG